MLIMRSPNLPAFQGNQANVLSSLFCRHWESQDPPQFPRCFWGGGGMGEACRIQTPLTASPNLYSLPCFCDLSLSVSLTPCLFPKAALTKDCWVSSQLFIKKKKSLGRGDYAQHRKGKRESNHQKIVLNCALSPSQAISHCLLFLNTLTPPCPRLPNLQSVSSHTIN